MNDCQACSQRVTTIFIIYSYKIKKSGPEKPGQLINQSHD
jgi:hypothetical protein